MRLRLILLASLSTCCLWTGAQASPKARFYAYALEFALPYAINNVGQVVGTNGWRGYITGPNGKGATELGSFGLYTLPRDINDSGVVVGKSGGKAFITDPGGVNMREIVMPEENADAEALSVNEAGQVVGGYLVPSPFGYDRYNFITDPGGLNARRFDGLNPTVTRLSSINAHGQVVGTTSFYPEPTRSFVTGPNGVGLFEIDPGEADYVIAQGINDAGQVGGVAYGYAGGRENPFVANASQPIRVKSNLGGYATSFGAINAHGDIVGLVEKPRNNQRAYVATFRSEPVQIDQHTRGLPQGTVFTMANDINDRRQIVVAGTAGYIVCPTPSCE